MMVACVMMLCEVSFVQLKEMNYSANNGDVADKIVMHDNYANRNKYRGKPGNTQK